MNYKWARDYTLELINQYGTYNIQPTADTENVFPAIAQGLAEGFAERKNQIKE